MADEKVIIPMDIDDEALLRRIEEQSRRIEALESTYRELNDAAERSYDGIAKAATDTSKAIEENSKTIDKSKAALKGGENSTKAYKEALSAAADEVNILGVNLGETISGLKAKAATLKTVVSGLSGGTKALKVFKVALISTGIGAIVVALGSLVALLTRTQKGVDGVSRVLKGLGATVDVFIDRASSLGNALVKLFSGDLRGAAEDAKAAINGIGDEIRNEFNAAVELERRAQRLRDRQRDINVEIAKQTAEIERLRNASQDTNRPIEERIRILEEVGRIQADIEREAIDAAEENLAIIRERNALGESLSEDLDAEAEAEIELANIRGESATRQREDLALIRSLRSEAAEAVRAQQQAELDRVADLTEKYRDLLGVLQERTQDAELSLLGDLDRLQREREIALEQIDDFANEIRARAANLGEELPSDFEDNIGTLVEAVDKKFREEVDKLRGETEVVDSLVLPGFDPEAQAAKINDQISSLASKIDADEEVLSVFEKLKGNILSTLGIDEAEASFLVDQFSTIFDTVSEGLTANIELQIKQNDLLIESIEETTNQLQGELAEQKALKDRGLANDVGRLEFALEEQNNKLREAEEERLELERKAANQRLVQDSLQQASSLALAAAQLISAESSKGLIGIATAAAGLALLFSIFSKAKANAREFSSVPKLRKGKKLKGRTHEQGGNPIYIANDPAPGPAYEAEKDEWLIGTAPSREHDKHLEKLNDGEYAGLDLVKILADFKRTEKVRRSERPYLDILAKLNGARGALGSAVRGAERGRVSLSRLKIKEDRENLLDGLEQIFGSSLRDVLDAIKSRPVVYPKDTKYRAEYYKGRTKVVKNYSPE
jgi:hypothetical protein